MGVADLIKKFDTTSSEKVDIKIFQPDQVSALAKSGLKIDHADSADVRTSPKKPKAVGLATATRQVVVSERSSSSPKRSAQVESISEEEPVEENKVEEDKVEEEKVEEEKVEEEPVEEESVEEKVEEEKVEEEPVEEESVEEKVEEESVEEEKVEEESVEEEKVEEPVEEEKAEEPVEEEKAEEPVEETTEQPLAEDNEADAEDVADSASENIPAETGSNLRQEKEEQQEQKEEEEQQKEVSESLQLSDSMSEYLASTKDMPKPPLDTRLGRDDPFVFGTRFIPEDDEEAIWNHNSWDHFQFNQEDIDNAKAKIELQKEVQDKEKYLGETAYKHWDNFYSQHKENFFKDRKWLAIEFPILNEVIEPEYGPVKVLEVGCGVGNTFNCILKDNKNPDLKIHASDYSYTAIDLIKQSDFYQEEHEKGTIVADRWDITDLKLPVEEGTVDVIIMIFVFSALEPQQWKAAIDNAAKLLKKGGKILFRDYGRYDLAQVRFKGEKILSPNFYIRGDGTRVYFFTDEEIEEIFTGNDQFDKVKIGIDRRLLVNRKKKIKMYRQWIQAVFEKK
ncbi:tRNA(Thr) (cytosine(32)-N(3))-methyltransferase [Hanseniaspora uvarum]|nr:tRNA(Thr) (cytosine(32)-N(3))-methyltransferase [Hanseniaspora uvarum]